MSVLSYIGLGANLGDAPATLKRAIARIAALDQCSLHAQSGLFRTAPIDADGADYTNAVVAVHTRYCAEELLTQLQAIEQDFGRTRDYYHAPRTLDLDILLYGDETIDLPHLQIPHPRMHQRAFVLLPLVQIEADAHIPGKGKARDFLEQVANQSIRPI